MLRTHLKIPYLSVLEIEFYENSWYSVISERRFNGATLVSFERNCWINMSVIARNRKGHKKFTHKQGAKIEQGKEIRAKGERSICMKGNSSLRKSERRGGIH